MATQGSGLLGFSNGTTSGFGAISDILGGFLGLSEASAQADALSKQGAFQRDAYLLNSRLAALQAQQAIAKGQQEAVSIDVAGSQLEGQQRAKAAASGVDVNTGSSVDTMIDIGRQSAAGAATAKANAWREAMGYQFESEQYRKEAEFTDASTKTKVGNTLMTGGLGYAKTFLGNSGTQ